MPTTPGGVMLSNAKESFHEKAGTAKRRLIEKSSQASEELKQEACKAKDRAITSAQNTAREMVAGLEKIESEIANHYLDGMKYGMAGG